ncbi:Myb-like DNA-binding domain containing protein [Tritrichomonas foetus]|uniref:Myb-like DNA-binding domain containing protein n=1 Tax=Tritrichomonas foetus TaxID=1144522 RepID=A0A1J4KTT2_9EUKA|nr:Myb-like DNA-binding domain containing protein [Tritrichomonas foetus]|eukprot:OHT14697.1 Myb-like DNA-binding domain containing protein [Tritrichomonas foetus]
MIKILSDMSDSLAPTRKQHKSRSHPKATKWTQKEDTLLLNLVQNSMHVSWTELAPQFPGKTAQQISERWSKVVDPSLIKGGWTREEDETITNFVAQYGVKNWTKLAQLLPGRIGKQCRERWRNHLDPNNKSSPWTPDEDNLLLQLHQEYGNSWVKIANFMPGRSDNCIKNRWNSTLKKRMPGQIAIAHTPEKKTRQIETPDSIPKPDWNLDQKSLNSYQANSGSNVNFAINANVNTNNTNNVNNLNYINNNVNNTPTGNDPIWGNPFESPYMAKSPFSPFMKSFSPWTPSESFFTPRIMRSPHFSNDASLVNDIMSILDKE